MSHLVQQKRMDYTGKTVTRWVRANTDGAPAIKAPMVKAKSQPLHLETAMSTLFTTREEGYTPDVLVNLFGNSVFYSPKFAREAMSKLPVATLRVFNAALEKTPAGTKAHGFLAYEAYDHIREIYDMGQTGAAKAIIARSVVRISNAAVFIDAFTALSSTKDPMSPSEYRTSYDKALAAMESRVSYDADLETEVNYAKLPKAQQDNACALIMAHALHARYGETDPSIEMVEFVKKNRDRWGELAQLAADRGFKDFESLQSILDHDNPSLSEGML